MRLRQIYTYIKIGSYEFFTGDGYLQSLQISLGEDDRAHTCKLEFSDPRLKIGAAKFKQSFDAGGIAAPDELLVKATEQEGAGDGALAQARFTKLDDIPEGLQGDALAEVIVGFALSVGVTSDNHLAAILATCEIESQMGVYVVEIPRADGYAYLARQGIDPKYHGRGLVQLTIRENYEKAGNLIGVNLVRNPGLATLLKHAVPLLVLGMRDALYTRWRLSDFGGTGAYDFFGSRKIVNPGEVTIASKMAKYTNACKRWLARLEAGEFNSTPTPAAADTIAPSDVQPVAVKNGPPRVLDVSDAAPTQVNEKGQEIIIGIGEAFENLTNFHYIHTKTAVRVRPNTIALKGQAVRWLLSRRKKNTTYQKITLRELAERVCNAHGLVLEMDGNGPRYEHLDQTGLSDFGLLYRECQAVGFKITEKENRLIIAPLRPSFTGFVVTADMLHDESVTFTDTATADMPANRAAGSGTGSASEPKVEVDPSTGAMEQMRMEDSRGTGDMGASAGGGGGGEAIAERIRARQAELAQQAIEAAGEATGARRDELEAEARQAITGDATPPIYGTITISDEAAALPSQKTGSIALASGEVWQAEQLKSELQRVKGYESVLVLKMTDATLTLVPGSIIAIAPDVAGPTFAREWRVGSVDHTINDTAPNPTTGLTIYTPQAAVKRQSANASDGAGNSAAERSDQTVSESGWLRPSDGVLTSDYRSRNPRRPRHFGVDLAKVPENPIYCSYTGTVVDVVKGGPDGDFSLGGGFGNRVFIESGEYTHYYCHLRPNVPWSVGDRIQQGELVGYEGNSGRSFGLSHLHWQCMRGGVAQDPANFFTL